MEGGKIGGEGNEISAGKLKDRYESIDNTSSKRKNWEVNYKHKYNECDSGCLGTGC
jgi:hypothetical protein